MGGPRRAFSASVAWQEVVPLLPPSLRNVPLGLDLSWGLRRLDGVYLLFPGNASCQSDESNFGSCLGHTDTYASVTVPASSCGLRSSSTLQLPTSALSGDFRRSWKSAIQSLGLFWSPSFL